MNRLNGKLKEIDDVQKTIIRVLNKLCYTSFENNAISVAYDKDLQIPEATKNYIKEILAQANI